MNTRTYGLLLAGLLSITLATHGSDWDVFGGGGGAGSDDTPLTVTLSGT